MHPRPAINGNALFLALILGMAIGIGGGCGAGDGSFFNDSPGAAMATFYGGSFALDDIVLPDRGNVNGSTISITGTPTQIQYVLTVPYQTQTTSGTVTFTLLLDGDFTIPAGGNVDGATGTVTDVIQSSDGETEFQITGLSVDAGQLTAALAAGSVDGFWVLIAGGALDITASSLSGPTNLYCTAAGEGTPSDNLIVISTTMTVSIQQFLQTC
jgi:hypothetical protein